MSPGRRPPSGGRRPARSGPDRRTRGHPTRGAAPERPHRRTGPAGLGGDQVEGRQSVRELLAAGRRPVRRLLIAEGLDPSVQLDEIEELARRRKVRIESVSRTRLDNEARTDAPQGVVAMARPMEPVELDDLCTNGSGRAASFLMVVAGVTDPRNLGALLRSAECAGVTGVVLARHRAAHLTPTVAKVAAGAIEHLDFSLVGGIPTALSRLADLGVRTIGLAGEVSASLYDLDLGDQPVALVVGGEEKGLAPLVRKRCDDVVAIPQYGDLPSLNVGVAGAVACFEVARQRAAAGG